MHVGGMPLKGMSTCMRFFFFKVVWPIEPIWAPDKCHKICSILFSNSLRCSTFYAFRVFSVHIHTDSLCVISVSEKIHFAYYQFMTDSFFVFSKYAWQNSFQRSTLFRVFSIYVQLCVFSGYEQIHSVYSQ